MEEKKGRIFYITRKCNVLAFNKLIKNIGTETDFKLTNHV